jgi:uncharacterized membrane protein YecN with MAPEG domain
MAKRHEFRPDKRKTSLLSHFWLTPKQQKVFLKWVLYAALIVAVSVVQDVALSKVRLHGATTELVPCVIFLICILENSQQSCIFALVSGLLYLFSGMAPGIYSMVAITFLGVGVSIFRQTYLQESFSSAVLCIAGAMLVYELVNFGFGLFLRLTYLSRFSGFLITAGLSLLAIPVLYPVSKVISAIGGNSWRE